MKTKRLVLVLTKLSRTLVSDNNNNTTIQTDAVQCFVGFPVHSSALGGREVRIMGPYPSWRGYLGCLQAGECGQTRHLIFLG